MVTLIIKRTLAKIEAVTLDASVSENHLDELEVTEHPIEKGADITDHARKKPATLTITGVLSNTPLSREADRRIIASDGVFLETTALDDRPSNKDGYAQAAYKQLLEYQDKADGSGATLITITTALRTYTNMLMTSIAVPKDAKTGDAIMFTATFKRAEFVQTKTTSVVVAREPKAKAKVKTGKQVAKPTADATKRKSLAYQLSEKLGLLEKMGIK